MDVEATPAIRVICALLVLFPTISGVLFHFVIIAVFFKEWKNFRKNSFYLIIIQIVGCSIYLLFIYLYFVFPISLTGVQYMGDGFLLYDLPLYLESVAFAAMLFLTFLISLNRLAIFVFPRINDIIFSAKNTLIISGVIWIYIFTTVAFNQLSGCKKHFSKEEMYIWKDCAEQIREGLHFHKFIMYQNYLLGVLMCLVYLIIYAKIRRRKNLNVGKFKKEIPFLIQTIPISVLFVIQMAMFRFIPVIGITGYARFFAVALENLVIIANGMSSPVMLLIFNVDVRKYALNVFRNNATSTVLVVM